MHVRAQLKTTKKNAKNKHKPKLNKSINNIINNSNKTTTHMLVSGAVFHRSEYQGRFLSVTPTNQINYLVPQVVLRQFSCFIQPMLITLLREECIHSNVICFGFKYLACLLNPFNSAYLGQFPRVPIAI